jgi:hypothetical protein
MRKKNSPEEAQNHKEDVRNELIEVLLANIRESGDPRSIELLGKFKPYDLFARPTPAQNQDPIGERTAGILVNLAKRLDSKDVRLSLDLANKLLKLAEQTTPEERNKANLGPYDLDYLKAAIRTAEDTKTPEPVGHQPWELPRSD